MSQITPPGWRLPQVTSVTWILVLWICHGLAPRQNSAAIAAPEKAAPGTQTVVSRVQAQLERGELQWQPEAGTGYLLPLLHALDIPKESQLLVFSKTSCQRDKISPRNPRAIYFNDRAYVAWIPGAPLLEISHVEPGVGAVFHTLDQRESGRPKLVRRDQCLECHTSSRTENIPGYLVRSYATDGQGIIDITDGYSMVDHGTPLAERWGGWYICGGLGSLQHRGSPIGTSTASTALPDQVQLSAYPQPSSDIVALMVLEHQARMQNLITKLHVDSADRSGQPVDPARWKPICETVLRYLLFTTEARLSSPITGASEFSKAFATGAPSDRQGRSLRQFDLQTRLFKYPCSYMIYSESFDALPRPTKLHLYHRLWTILSEGEKEGPFASLSAESRQAIREILLETKSDLPFYWRL